MIYITSDTHGSFNCIADFCGENHTTKGDYVEKEYPSILFAKDGEVYDLDGKKAIAIGRAYSIDKMLRIMYSYGRSTENGIVGIIIRRRKWGG